MRKVLSAVILAVMLASSLLGDVKLPGCLSDNMVLQQKAQVKFWGWAEPGEKVAVKPAWTLMKYDTTADENGEWVVFLTTPATDGRSFNIDISGNNEITLKNVLLGEVWLCSGQSNMQWELQQTLNHEEEVATADQPEIRLLYVPRSESAKPLKDLRYKWEECTPQTAKRCSAVGYFYGRELQERLNVPIGIITSAYGGTPAEAWVRTEVIANNPELKPIYERDLDFLARRPELEAEFATVISDWQEARKEKPSLKKPRYPDNLRMQHRSGYLFNSMLYPIINYHIKGAIWYQGETNVPRAYQYAELIRELINNWREEWGYEFPFYIVQLPPYNYSNPQATTCPELQESQKAALELANTGLAIISDVGNLNNVHPKNKQTVGRRLADLALSETYGYENICCYGPMYKDVEIKGNKAIISFDSVNYGLKAEGELREFEIAGNDKVFYPAKAIIDGAQVIVTCDKVNEPVAVRFAWHNGVSPNLFNSKGLPACSFRTDSWPCSTFEIR